MILAVSALFRIAPSGWLISWAICGGHFARSGKAVDVRELHHPLPRLHLRRMTAMPLKEKQRDETALKQEHGADGQDRPAVGFPRRGRFEENRASRRQVALADPPSLHLPPVVFR